MTVSEPQNTSGTTAIPITEYENLAIANSDKLRPALCFDNPPKPQRITSPELRRLSGVTAHLQAAGGMRKMLTFACEAGQRSDHESKTFGQSLASRDV
jgi:hypothetical protein